MMPVDSGAQTDRVTATRRQVGRLHFWTWVTQNGGDVLVLIGFLLVVVTFVSWTRTQPLVSRNVSL